MHRIESVRITEQFQVGQETFQVGDIVKVAETSVPLDILLSHGEVEQAFDLAARLEEIEKIEKSLAEIEKSLAEEKRQLRAEIAKLEKPKAAEKPVAAPNTAAG